MVWVLCSPSPAGQGDFVGPRGQHCAMPSPLWHRVTRGLGVLGQHLCREVRRRGAVLMAACVPLSHVPHLACSTGMDEQGGRGLGQGWSWRRWQEDGGISLVTAVQCHSSVTPMVPSCTPSPALGAGGRDGMSLVALNGNHSAVSSCSVVGPSAQLSAKGTSPARRTRCV